MFRKANFHLVDKVLNWHSTFYRKAFNLVIVTLLLANLGVAGTIPTVAAAAAPTPAAAPTVAPASPNAPLDTPDTLVSSGVSDYTISAPKLFWHTAPAPCPPHIASNPNDQFMDIIGRVAIQGSLPRNIYSQQLVCDALTGRFYSNVVADDNYLYFTKADGLYRLSVDANVGDAPQLVNALVSGYAQLAIDTDHVFVLMFNNDTTGTINMVNKSNNQRVFLTNTGTNPGALQVSFAYNLFSQTTDYFLYWLQGGSIHRHDLNTGTEISINPGSGAYLIAYYAEGGHFFCSGLICSNSDLVYFSTGSQVKYYNNFAGSYSGVVYDAGASNSVYDLVTDDNHIFFLQDFTGTCSPEPCFPPHTYYVVRHNRSASGTTDFLYSNSSTFTPINSIQAASEYIFWQDTGQVLRLPKTAGALPTTNMSTTGMEITQGIQKPDNSVRLIENKRTFVRLFVQSDGPNVPGITATLDGYGTTCGDLGALLPANPVGTNITVPASPQRANLNDSFLFELPWSWTTCGSLYLTGRINPYHAPPESTFSDNALSSGPFNFSASPRLQVQFIAWQYVLFNTFHTPQFIRDILETFSWIRRAYPVNSTPGMSTDPSAGFRPGLWFVGDDSLGAKVQGSDPSCQDLLWTDSKGVHDDRNLCASRYTNQQMVSIRAENGLPGNLFFYGMLADTKNPNNGNWVFPRGQACCGTAVSTGPAGADGVNGYFWYNGDGTYADWYAAHEIGHTLGRAHPVTKGPNAAARACGQSEDDASYPYNYAQIGPNDNTEGFDAGDPALGQPMRIYPGTQWFDVMSYCAEQWISDYTYEAMYQYAIAHPSLDASAPQAGDWLSVSGIIVSGTDTASINRIRHIQTTATQPPLVPGGYAIRLFNASNTQLASYEFTADPMDGDPTLLTFTQVVVFAPGTAKVAIVKLSDNKVMTSVSVPAHNPTISSVALQGAPNPVAGTVTLGWTASDPDGRPLTFDIYYVRNGNPTPRIVKLDATGSTASIDTSTFGGSGVFRVIASDGFNTAQANSPTYTMANKPPLPRIDTPADGLHVHYGQLINFSGEASDPQDGSLTGGSLVWTSDKGALGTGELVSSADLPVGTRLITLTTKNSLGLSAHVTITVYVDDNLSLLDSTLTAGPAQLGWTFPAGSTTPQSSTLNIGNAGGGTLTWKASSNSAWLKLNQTSGTAPSSITVTADPTGIPNGTGLGGTITIIAPATSTQPTQTVTIPAGIVVGDLMEKPGYIPLYVYLPFTRK